MYVYINTKFGIYIHTYTLFTVMVDILEQYKYIYLLFIIVFISII